MAWTTPAIVEICVGMEVTSYRVRRDLIFSGRFTASLLRNRNDAGAKSVNLRVRGASLAGSFLP